MIFKTCSGSLAPFFNDALQVPFFDNVPFVDDTLQNPQASFPYLEGGVQVKNAYIKIAQLLNRAASRPKLLFQPI